jgi:L-methionine (R)-S-oxide reductase
VFTTTTNPIESIQAIIGGEPNMIARCANTASVLWHVMSNINWVGVYLVENNELVLGPFMGKPACIRIAIGKGVCGTAAQQRTTIVVPDVHLFEGHIACDAESRSEVVVPLIDSSGRLLGVLDVDSPLPHRFDDRDVVMLERVASILAESQPNT